MTLHCFRWGFDLQIGTLAILVWLTPDVWMLGYRHRSLYLGPIDLHWGVE